jgi:hypothetical protein
VDPSQPPSWELEIRYDEDSLEEIMEDKSRATEREDSQVMTVRLFCPL